MNTARKTQLIVIPQVSLPDQIVHCQEELQEIEQLQLGLSRLRQEVLADAGPIVKKELGLVENDLDDRHAERERILSALQLGYPEISLPHHEEWKTGFPKHEDPRPFKWAGFLFSLVFIEVGILVLSVIGVGLANNGKISGDPIYPYIWAGFITLMFITMAASSFTERKNKTTLTKNRFDTYASFLRGDLPSVLMNAHRDAKASDLFDSIQVFAPKEAFRQRDDDMPMIVFGKMDNRTFLIAQNPRGLQAGRKFLFWQLQRKML